MHGSAEKPLRNLLLYLIWANRPLYFTELLIKQFLRLYLTQSYIPIMGIKCNEILHSEVLLAFISKILFNKAVNALMR